MSIVIVGGHDRMVGQYKKICKSYKCKCKVFTQMEADFGKKIGCPDLLVLFTNTVSHKMVQGAVKAAKKNSIPIARVQSSSISALRALLGQRGMVEA